MSPFAKTYNTHTWDEIPKNVHFTLVDIWLIWLLTDWTKILFWQIAREIEIQLRVGWNSEAILNLHLQHSCLSCVIDFVKIF